MNTSRITTLIDGQPADVVSVSNRGLAYGDGLFETMLVVEGCVPLFRRHMSRLRASCDVLGIPAVADSDCASDAFSLISRDDLPARCVLKLTVTRGAGGRGYAPSPGAAAVRVMQLFDLNEEPEDELVGDVLDTRLGSNRQLAGLKHLNRLEQVVAARELGEKKLQEGLLCNENGFLIEAVSSNLFLAFEDKVVTPKLDTAGVRGVMRDCLIEKSLETGLPIEKDYVFSSAIAKADEIILCNSVRGVRRLARLGERALGERRIYERLRALADTALSPSADSDFNGLDPNGNE